MKFQSQYDGFLKATLLAALFTFGLATVPRTAMSDDPEANTEIRLKYPDGKQCGFFGCSKNADGTFSPNYAPRQKVPVSNTEIRLHTSDAKACGLFGCSKNADGTFSPNYAPAYVTQNVLSDCKDALAKAQMRDPSRSNESMKVVHDLIDSIDKASKAISAAATR